MVRLVVCIVVLLASAVARAACGGGAVILNELQPDAPGADAGAEWVELLALGQVDLSGWRVERATRPGGWEVVFQAPPGLALARDERVVLAGPAAGVSGAVVVPQQADMGNAGSNSDAVRLVDCHEAVVDVVAYGRANAPGQAFADEQGHPIDDVRLAPLPGPGQALARVPDGVDTGDGRADFAVQEPTPGQANSEPFAGDTGARGCDAGPGSGVVLNELLVDPPGADAGAEWVELAHGGAARVEVSGWRVERATRPGAWAAVFTLPEGVTLEVGAHPVLAGPAASGGPDPLVLVPGAELGNAVSGADAVRLVDCLGGVADVVVYGAGAEGEGFEDEAGRPVPPERLAPRPPPGASLARSPDAADSGDAAADFVIADPPSPGRPNPGPSACAPAAGVRINELLPNPAGADAQARAEWVELHHGGAAPASLEGWSLVAYTRGAGPDAVAHARVRLPEGAVVPPGGLLVVGEPFAPVVDVAVEALGLPGGSGGDLLVLEDCAGARVDGVLYGGDNTDGLAEDDGAVPARGAPRPGDDQCVARRADGLDHDRSVDDLVTTSACTPGAPNGRPDTGGADPPPGEGCGRGGVAGRPPGGAPQGAGCAVLPSGAGVPLLALSLALLGRRRVRGRGVVR